MSTGNVSDEDYAAMKESARLARAEWVRVHRAMAKERGDRFIGWGIAFHLVIVAGGFAVAGAACAHHQYRAATLTGLASSLIAALPLSWLYEAGKRAAARPSPAGVSLDTDEQ